MQQELKTILQSLTDKDLSDSKVAKKTFEVVDGLQDSYELIYDLTSEIQRIKDFRGDREPFYYLYLSIAYLKHKDYKSAKNVLATAVFGFQIQGYSLNEAMGEWLFSIIHFEIGDNEQAQKACEDAIFILEKLIKQYEEERRYGKAKVYREYLEQMERFQEEIRNYTKHNLPLLLEASHENRNSKTKRKINLPKFLLGTSSKRMPPEDTPLRISKLGQSISSEHEQKYSHDDGPQKDSVEPLGDGNIEPLVKHLIIPVDLGALKDLSPKLRILDSELFDKLHQYEKRIGYINGQNETRSTPNPAHLRRVTIPSLPLYGQAATSPNGEPKPDSFELENAEAVNNDVYINFNGQDYIVMFINNQQTTIIFDRRYGWFKVIGQGMNNSSPITVNDNDYVLFCKTDDLESCENKIVIATQPGLDEQHPLLIVKRLIATNPKVKNSGNPRKQYYLHSESSRDKYKDDIEFTDETQLIGEVIAIAKPVR